MTRIGITGHQALSPQVTKYVRAHLKQRIAASDGPLVGITSLADGADQIFARLLLQKKHRLHIIVPCAQYEEAFTDDAAREAYRRLLGQSHVFEVLPFAAPSEDAFWAAGQRIVELSEKLYAVWDGQPARGFGGTAEVVHYARRWSVPVEVVWPEGVTR